MLFRPIAAHRAQRPLQVNTGTVRIIMLYAGAKTIKFYINTRTNCDYDSRGFHTKLLRRFVAGTSAGTQVLVPNVPHLNTEILFLI